MLDLRLDRIGKYFPPVRHVLKDITLTVGAGECLAMLGPSGCGKTTLLRIIAGLEKPTSGELFLGGQNAANVPSHRRNVAILFQRPALVPAQTVRQNLRWAWTLREPWAFLRRRHPREADLEHVASLLDLEHDLDRPVQELSGGQQQRVALGRCLLREASICLLDEPLGHLDAPLRVELRRQIRALARVQSMTLIHVTHDPEEALAVGDRVAVIHEGRIVQIDEPAMLQRLPRNRYVAELVHQQQGGLNLIAGNIVRDGESLFFESVYGRWPAPASLTFVNNKNFGIGRLREGEAPAEPRTQARQEPGHPKLGCRENFHAETGKVHMMFGIAACNVRCEDALSQQPGEIRLTMPMLQRECSSAGSWIIAGDDRGRWTGRSESNGRASEVTMTFSIEQGFWFDGITGQTLCAPAG